MPLLFNWAEGGKTPPMPLERLKELGYRIIIFPIGALLMATQAVRRLLAEIREHGSPMHMASEWISFQEFNEMIGLAEIRELEKRFSTKSGNLAYPTLGAPALRPSLLRLRPRQPAIAVVPKGHPA